jgi:hypothetical protein
MSKETNNLKIILIILCCIVGLSIFFATCNYLHSGLDVTLIEYSPEAMLKKYEWFKSQSQLIQKAQKDIANSKMEPDIRMEYERDNGTDHSKWSPILLHNYHEDITTSKEERLALVANCNKLIADYRAQASKFNWSSFQGRDDLPPTDFKDIK